jgi:hypothetical protein
MEEEEEQQEKEEEEIHAKIMRTTQKIQVSFRPWIEPHIATRPSVLCRRTELTSHTYLYNSLHMTCILLPEIVARK